MARTACFAASQRGSFQRCRPFGAIGAACGQEQSHEILKPGESYKTETYLTHPWRIRTAATKALLVEIPGLTMSLSLSFP